MSYIYSSYFITKFVNNKFMRTLIIVLFGASCLIGCSGSSSVTNGDIQENAQAFIDEYTKELLDLYYVSAKAEWKSNTENETCGHTR